VNYRHQYHAGNFADVFKHSLLVGLIRALQRKEAGFLYLDTHAGRGAYELGRAGRGERLARRPEHPEGIGRIRAASGAPALVADYLERVRARESGPAPAAYPGSPLLAAELARPQDRVACCERQPAEFDALRRLLGGRRRVALRSGDGYAGLRALLPPPERRALVLIDPPFEDADEDERILAALREGLARLSRGIYAVWYPITERFAAGRLLAGLRTLAPAPCLAADLIVDPEGEGLRGCGLAVLNPPWRFDLEAEQATAWLARALAQSPRSNGAVRWLTSQAATSARGG
jgi:23S rRNA (adenine2030-N6)-methyltransferase